MENIEKFENHLKITQSEFELLMNKFYELKLDAKLKKTKLRMTLHNKILMGVLFVIEYPGDKVLAELFGVSVFT